MSGGSASRDSYDAVVVGSGLGGVTAAAVLARAGLSVLLCERNDGPGGLAHAFKRGPYTFDPAVHFTLEAGDGQFLDLLLRHLDVRDKVQLVPLSRPYHISMPGVSLRPPLHADGFVESLSSAFPSASDGIRSFIDVVLRFFDEATRIQMQIGLRDLDAEVARNRTFFRYRTKTLEQVLDEFVNDQAAKATLAAFWIVFGLPPSKLSFYLYAQYLSLLLLNGAYYCLGGFQELVDAFVAALERDGGELVVGTAVERILVTDGRANGVVLANGQRVSAPLVISNADARMTLDQLVGQEHLPEGYVKRLHRMEPSLSIFSVYAATRLDLNDFDPASEVYVFSTLDHEAVYESCCQGRPDGIFAATPSVLDGSHAPEGEHVGVVACLAPYDLGEPWHEAKQRYTDALLEVIDGVYPSFREQMTFCEQATPVTLERFTGNYRGAAYGWAMRADQVASKRLAHDTPVQGLYLSGHWTQEGSGSFRVMLSGIRTARMALAPLGLADDVPQL